jgi:D-aminoacyl-tRNA deacylase
MRVVVQRVVRAAVRVGGETVGAVGPGLCVFACVMEGDTAADAAWMSERLVRLRIFADAEGKMNLGLAEVAAPAVLLISQFTLAAELAPGLSKGNRPSFGAAAKTDVAVAHLALLRDGLCGLLPALELAEGQFGADMQVELVNDGPATFVLDSRPGRSA